MKNKRIIKINKLYLKNFNIYGEHSFDVEIFLTNYKDAAEKYEVEDIPKILDILKIFGFEKCFAEEEIGD